MSDLVYFLYRIIRVYIIIITYSLISFARMSTQRVLVNPRTLSPFACERSIASGVIPVISLHYFKLNSIGCASWHFCDFPNNATCGATSERVRSEIRGSVKRYVYLQWPWLKGTEEYPWYSQVSWYPRLKWTPEGPSRCNNWHISIINKRIIEGGYDCEYDDIASVHFNQGNRE